MSVVKERRRHLRTVVTWPVAVLTPQTQIEGQIENINTVGAFISFAESPPLEWNSRMLIKPPNHQTINVVAKVVWSTVLGTGVGAPRFGVGVEFTRLSEGDPQFLAGSLELPTGCCDVHRPEEVFGPLRRTRCDPEEKTMKAKCPNWKTSLLIKTSLKDCPACRGPLTRR